MKRLLMPLLVLVLAPGCVVVPASTAVQACSLLDTAQREAQMAPAWYLEAGQVLARCGQKDAIKDAEARACYAEVWNGYRKTEECDAL